MSKLNYYVKTLPLSMVLTYLFAWGLCSAFLFTLGIGFQWEKINAMFTWLSRRWCHVSYFNGNIITCHRQSDNMQNEWIELIFFNRNKWDFYTFGKTSLYWNSYDLHKVWFSLPRLQPLRWNWIVALSHKCDMQYK